ncbi:hypothetical protein BDQ17DRAFT_1430234 [Cyathus striatus]|nr:hypothetical protein BDQ17DRAFT_1430234 [Cyathus striatus]
MSLEQKKLVPNTAEEMKLHLKNILPGTHERGVLDVYGGTLDHILIQYYDYPFSEATMSMLFHGLISFDDIPYMDHSHCDYSGDDMSDEESDFCEFRFDSEQDLEETMSSSDVDFSEDDLDDDISNEDSPNPDDTYAVESHDKYLNT